MVVEDDELFPDAYPNTLVVPLTRDEGVAFLAFSERIEPLPTNGADVTCWALAHHVSTVSLRRVQPTSSRVTDEQMQRIRQKIALAIGIPFATTAAQ